MDLFQAILARQKPHVTQDARDPEALALHAQVARTKAVLAVRRARLVLRIRIRQLQARQLIFVHATPVSSGSMSQAKPNSHVRHVSLDITRSTNKIWSARFAVVISIVSVI